MADSKLRLQIVTALDNAGLKATKEQIDKMENALSKFNKNGGEGLSGLEKKLGKIPGPVGKIADVFEGLGGKVAKFGGIATAVIGAFKTGWDIGSWVYEKVITPLFKIKDPIEELKKHNKKAAEGFDKLTQSIDDAAESSLRLQEKSTAALQKEIKDIQAASEAWQQAARSKLAYINAGQDVETQMLERQRFEDVLRLQQAGDYEGAEQASKMYDVFAAELRAKQEIQRFDEETAILEKQVLDNDEKKVQLLKQAAAAQEAYNRKVAERDKFDKAADDLVMTSAQYRQYQRRMRTYERDIEKLKSAWEDAERSYENYDTGDSGLVARRLQRMALVGRATLSTDQAAMSYDQFVEQNGNKLGTEFSKEFKDSLASASRQSYESLSRALTNRDFQRLALNGRTSFRTDPYAFNYNNVQFTQQFRDTLTQTTKESYDSLARAVKEGVAEGVGLLLEVK